ncbi:kinase-like domain-containing protein [Papiliotrema laurentii]|uniref:Kinase-like domain-containing protein n=1 Tax=Papiliotrema laurentii TaxID=5418 RepID=A0AAD9CWY0_PAPLA|nr:kinase-like domain-containing protein [Papiliotrema laurentii]
MPPRRTKAVPASATTMGVTPSTPATVSSTTSSRRKPATRGTGYHLEGTFDSVGQQREVIVIDDSESPAHAAARAAAPVTRKRTRAQVAAEAAAHHPPANGYNGADGPPNSTGSMKKRKVDEVSDVGVVKKPKQKVPTSTSLNYAPPSKPAPAAAPAAATQLDDAEGHFIVRPEDWIGNKYKIVRLLGQGTFGKVVEARHIETRKKVAIKVIRAVQKYRDASRIEIRVLETLKKHDPHNLNKCIHLEEYFDYRGHPCLVSELYGMSVFDFLKQNSFAPFPIKHIQDFAKSLLKSVDFLHRLRLVHTDLKPENILLVSNDSRLNGPRVKGSKARSILLNTDIRLIDFGSATFENEYHSSVVSTRHYRAPEIILGLPWSYPCDLFSIGCILVEFYTGDALFQTHDNLEHLAMMEVVMGKMPSRMVDKGRAKKPEFFKGNKIDYPNPSVSRSSRKFVKSLKPLHELIPPTSTHNKLFLDLIQRLLDFDPDHRITVSQALHHSYCTLDIPEGATCT